MVASVLLHLAGPSLAYLLLLPLYFRLFPPSRFPWLLPLVQSSLLPLAAALLLPSLAAAHGFRRQLRRVPPPRGSATRRALRRAAVLTLTCLVSACGVVLALRTQGELGRARRVGEGLLRREWTAVWATLEEGARAHGFDR